ncbi:hypothetical protein RHMOL_Rhmol09G0101400 [Rhododendron molle]|uniref:Uncharacterized protein n=1 Tax=Rhododendron molle TaxID=49168 RepID=A0ACC0MCX5_RHOML|nr:hypothetical protein RHMOL_Rhmol09G0101400 [Rhododendron molle]
MESPLAAILDPWLTRPKTLDWESPRSQCLTSIRDLRFMEPRPELLQAAMVYWDPVMHVFHFRNDEMCPIVEEFQAYLRGFIDCETLAIPPFQEDMSQLLQMKLNIPEELSTSIIQNGELNIVRLIELYGPEGALGDYVGQAHRRFVLSIYALAAYMLIPTGEGLWLSDKMGVREAPEASFEHFLRQLVERPMVYPELLIEEWYAFLNDMQSEDIVWRCPWLNLPEMTAYEYSWNNRELEEPLLDPITWLKSRYVKWLHKEVKARSGGYF